MNIIDEFFELFDNKSVHVSERVRVLNISFKYDGNKLPPKNKIKDLLSKFPKRDEVIITFSNVFDNSIIFNNKSEPIIGIDIEEFYEESKDDEEVSIQLDINKSIINNVISVYKFEEFSKYIVEKPLIQIMGIFHSLLLDKEYLVFELFDSNLLLSTNTMVFKNCQHEDLTIRFSRKNKIEICNEISSFLNTSDYKLLPEDFNIIYSTSNNIFENIFLKLRTLMSIIYISNTSIINNENLRLEVVGQRKSEFNYSINHEITENKELYKIYEWISTDGNAIDKAIIARNIISLHCQFTDIIKTDAKTFSSIQSNFKLYQKDNVDKYIELKNKVAEYILEIVNNTGNIVIELLDRLKQNMMACFTFLFSVILANLVSDRPLDNILTKEITVIFEFVLVGSMGFMFISVLEMNYKLKKLQDGYNELKNSYNGIFDDNDILNIFNNDNVFNNNINDAKKKRLIFIIIWIILLLICFVGIELTSDYPIVKSAAANIIKWVKNCYLMIK
ncbi:TPA: hypothetical protein ACKONR_001191 [Clostridioides difficile]|uniref:hypothetical protein n=1 Tax=Clostridioides difficile TaxID=1496 RepID=UPI00097FD631|nr:hypothetical protein [Clostridioides difficile]AXU29186.1 hypothetical protein CDIF102859_03523 [Clostridioides difficile]AXU32974.1 hypothetical protein CDIF102860_03538 [Clostridioides difficile]AXU36762.1 hypothetical protein CDIF102978_03538 [Clostridioides difficile]MCP8413116.1 hypothetical protein [Clostridioides difficile]MDC9390851.1 hypothetical protein [Clostridioides difficile]